MDTSALFIAGIALGVTLGALILALWMRGKLAQVERDKAVAETRLASSEAAAAKIGDTFQALADTALRSSQGAFLEAAKGTLETIRAEITGDLAQRQTAVEGVIQPLSTALERLDGQMREIEQNRQQTFGALQ
jgi:DNA recombination protein RmuC